jgi:hypothetical protein
MQKHTPTQTASKRNFRNYDKCEYIYIYGERERGKIVMKNSASEHFTKISMYLYAVCCNSTGKDTKFDFSEYKGKLQNNFNKQNIQFLLISLGEKKRNTQFIMPESSDFNYP